mgnify:CR=1 FL=1
MATRILMPKLGLTMTEGTITEWVVSAGEKVSKGSTVMLIETDKVEAEVEAEADGVVQYVANVGDTLEPGEVVGWLLEEDEQSEGEADQTSAVDEAPEVRDDASQELTEAELPEPEIAQSLQEEAAEIPPNQSYVLVLTKLMPKELGRHLALNPQNSGFSWRCANHLWRSRRPSRV